MVDQWSDLTDTDIAIIAVSFSICVLYHVFYFYEFFKRPYHINLGVNLSSRKNWVLIMMTDKAREITAVQTLRNGIMTCTFLATSASLIAFWAFTNGINASSPVVKVQYLVFGGCFVLSFLNMMFATRGFFHVSFLVAAKTLDPELEDALKKSMVRKKVKRNLFPKYGEKPLEASELGEELHDIQSVGDKELSNKVDKWTAKHVPVVVRLLKRSTVHFTAGLRFYYLAIPLAMWIISPWALLPGAIFIVLLMYYADHWV